MKIKLERKLLEQKLLIAVSVLGNNIQPPILNEALFKMEKKNLSITTSDGGVTMTTRLPYQLESGELRDFVCDVQSILKPVNLQKSEFMFLEVTEKDILFSTPKTRTKYKIPISYKAINFPLIKSEKWSDPITVDGKAFARMIKKTAVLANPNELRVGISGINLFAKENTLYIQSVNGGSAACITTFKPEGKDIPDIEPMLIPKSIAKVAANYEKSPEIKISLDEEKRNIGITDGSSVTYVRLLAGNAPMLDALKKQKVMNISTKISREEIILSIDRLSGFSNIEDKCIVFDFKGEGILLKSTNSDRRKEAEELVETNHKSKEMSFLVGFNYTVIRPAITSLLGENVFFSMSRFDAPMFITDDSSEGFETLWIVMGIKLAEHQEQKKSSEAEVNF
jgi:DNA polymerase-3 subunit beta